MKYLIGENFSIKNITCSGGSLTLNNYQPIFDSTVIQKLAKHNYTPHQVKVNEFEIDNNQDNNMATDIANNDIKFGIGSDTLGNIRKSALATGIIGFKPTYGLISRFGLFAVASAFDTVGIYAKEVQDIAKIGNILKGYDQNDMNTWDSEKIDLAKDLDSDISDKKLFYIKELASSEFLNTLKDKNLKTEAISINKTLINAIIPVYNTIMNAEMTTTLANLTGIPFGPCGKGHDADEMMFDYRSNFTQSTKKRLIMGAFSLGKNTIDKFYHNSLRIRHLIFDEITKLFSRYDALISDNNESSILLANLIGLPSIAIHDNLVITGNQKDDANILNIANILNKDGE